MMHPDTRAAVVAALRVELTTDPAGLGYAGKGAQAIADLLNASVVTQPAQVYQDVLISDVEGYLAARLLLVGIKDWIGTATPGPARQAARQLIDIIEGGRLRVFLTSDANRRVTVLSMFSGLCQIGAGGLTMQNYADIEAMTLAPAMLSATVGQPRWAHVVDGISAAPTPTEPIGLTADDPPKPIPHPGYSGPPWGATPDLVTEALS